MGEIRIRSFCNYRVLNLIYGILKMATAKYIENFKAICEKALILEKEDQLVNLEFKNKTEFASLADTTSTVFKLIAEWKNAELSLITDPYLQGFIKNIDDFIASIARVNSFQVDHNAMNSRSSITQELERNSTAIIKFSLNWLPLQIATQSFLFTELSNLEEKLDDLQIEALNIENIRHDYNKQSEDFKKNNETLLSNYQKSYQDQISDLQKITKDTRDRNDTLYADAERKSSAFVSKAEGILKNAKQISAEKAVKPYSKYFDETATNLNKTSFIWLGLTVGFAILTTIWAFISIRYFVSSANDTLLIIQQLSFKFLITGLLISAILWCGKQYKISRHLCMINKHKADALNTFEAFLEASNDIATRDAVLMQTTQTIFAQEASGYLDGKSDNQFDQYLKAINSMKNVVQTAAQK